MEENTLTALTEAKKYQIYSATAIGNFYEGGKYRQSLDSFFIICDSEESARELAEKNIDVITEMFKNKKLGNGKWALKKSEKSPIKIGVSNFRTGQKSFHKVLTPNNIFEQVDGKEYNDMMIAKKVGKFGKLLREAKEEMTQKDILKQIDIVQKAYDKQEKFKKATKKVGKFAKLLR